jgi:hypothetical protein
MAVAPVPTFTIIADALASARAYAWTTAQLTMLDRLIDALVDDFTDANPRFSAEMFRKNARYKYGYYV